MKMKKYASFDDYLDDQPPKNRSIIRALRRFVKRVEPELEESVKWGNGCWVKGQSARFLRLLCARLRPVRLFTRLRVKGSTGSSRRQWTVRAARKSAQAIRHRRERLQSVLATSRALIDPTLGREAHSRPVLASVEPFCSTNIPHSKFRKRREI